MILALIAFAAGIVVGAYGERRAIRRRLDIATAGTRWTNNDRERMWTLLGFDKAPRRSAK